MEERHGGVGCRRRITLEVMEVVDGIVVEVMLVAKEVAVEVVEVANVDGGIVEGRELTTRVRTLTKIP